MPSELVSFRMLLLSPIKKKSNLMVQKTSKPLYDSEAGAWTMANSALKSQGASLGFSYFTLTVYTEGFIRKCVNLNGSTKSPPSAH